MSKLKSAEPKLKEVWKDELGVSSIIVKVENGKVYSKPTDLKGLIRAWGKEDGTAMFKSDLFDVHPIQDFMHNFERVN